jgi:tetratricopeptide (TPR) repeat protein
VFSGLVVLAPQLLGGIYPAAMVAIAFAAGVCLVLTLLSARSTDLPTNLFLAVTLGPLLWTTFQVVPLPCGWVEPIAPLSAQRLRDVHSLFGLDAPKWCTLTRDPASTREEVIKGLALACSFLAAAMLAARGEQRVIFRAVAGSTVLMALVAFGHYVTGATSVFGLYEPVELRHAKLVAPLLNPNNLGGFLALGVPVLIGLSFEQSSTRVRFALLGAMGVVVGAALMTRSRGAAGALALGPALYAALALIRTRKAHAPRGPSWLRFATPVGICAVLALGAWAWFDELAVEFEASGWDKLDLIAVALRHASSVPLVGVGRGAFSASFVNTLENENRFDYAENLFVQWAVDWGAPVAVALTAALAWLLGRAAVKARSHARVGAVAGVATMVAQNLVDLGLELLGPALVTACLLGACASFPRSSRPAVRDARALRIVGGALAAAALIAPPVLARRLIEEHGPTVEQRLQGMLEHDSGQQFSALLQRAMLAHPSEPMLAIFGAHAAMRHKSPDAGRFINRGMLLAPGWSAPHIQAVTWLWNRGLRRQALLELRAAAELELQAVQHSLLCPIVKRDPEAVVAVAAPRGPSRASFLERVVHCLPEDSPFVAKIDAELLKLSPQAVQPRLRTARRLMKDARYDEAASLAEQASRVQPDHADAAVLAAQAYVRADRVDRAYEALERAIEGGANPSVILQELAKTAAGAKDRDKMEGALRRLRGWVGTDATALDRAYRIQAVLEHQLGNRASSLAAYEEAYRVAGSAAALRGVAQTAEALGDLRRALKAYGDLCAMGAEGGDACQRRDRLRAPKLKP